MVRSNEFENFVVDYGVKCLGHLFPASLRKFLTPGYLFESYNEIDLTTKQAISVLVSI